MIKATFQSLIGGVFTPNEQIKNLDMSQALNQTSLEGSTFIFNVECPGCDDNRIRDVYFLLTFNYAQLSQTLDSNKALKEALFNTVCQSYGFELQVTPDDHSQPNKFKRLGSSSGFSMVDFYITLFGSSRIMALCNVIGIEAGRLGLAQKPMVLPPWQRSNRTESQDTQAEKENEGQTEAKQTPEEPPKHSVQATNNVKPETLVPIEPSKTVDVPKVPATDSVQVTKSNSAISDKVGSNEFTTESPGSSIPSSTPDLKINPTPASATKDSSDKSSTVNPELKEPPEVVFVPPPADKLNSETTANGASGGQRESVWQKLSNKIKALERNVSLSGGYLEELSVRYKKQIEDLQLAVRQSGEALAASSKARENDRHQVNELKEEIGQLKLVVEEVSTRMETMSTWVGI